MSERVISTSWPRFLAGSAVFLIITFTLLEPGISDAVTGWQLLLFWTLHVVTALVILQSVQMALIRVPAVAGMSPWVQIGASGLIGAILFAPVAAGFDLLLGVDDMDDLGSESWAETIMGELTGSVGPVLTVWIALNVTRLLHIQSMQGAGPAPAPDAPEFWDRVPQAIGRDLVALSAELHYLRVYTVQGQALILYPLGRAVAQLDGVVAGVQIHRSHWVALAHLQRVERRGPGAVCLTTTGVSLPVSRRRKKEIDTALRKSAAPAS